MNAHDAIEGLLPFKIEFLPLQAIFDDFVLIYTQNVQVRCLQKRINKSLLSSYYLPLDSQNWVSYIQFCDFHKVLVMSSFRISGLYIGNSGFLLKNHEKKSISSSNIDKYNVYFKTYIQTYGKETIRFHTSMKEFGLTKGVYESFEHINKNVEQVLCSKL